MDAKLNQSDLISLFAKGSNISVAKAESFIKNFFDLIIEGLEQDGIVKINGLGTFKVTDVASRGSVNVNTGEKIEIKGHRKLTFIPADALKEQVNLPFAMFEPVEVDETYQPDYADAGESDEAADASESVADVPEPEPATPAIVEEPAVTEVVEDTTLPESVGQGVPEEVTETSVEENAVAEETVVEEPAAAIVEEVAEDITENIVPEEVAAPQVEKVELHAEETPAQKIEEEPVKVQERPSEPVVVRVPKKKSTEQKQTAQPQKGKKNAWSYYLVVIMVIAVGSVIYNRMERTAVVEPDVPKQQLAVATRDEVAKSTAAIVDQQPEQVSVVEEVAEIDTIAAEVQPSAVDEKTEEKVEEKNTATMEQPVSEEYIFVMVEELAAKNLKYITVADTLLYVADGELVEHKVAPDETLTRIARDYYGDKRLWPYIVKYNGMRDPNGLCSGMKISIPRLKPRK